MVGLGLDYKTIITLKLVQIYLNDVNTVLKPAFKFSLIPQTTGIIYHLGIGRLQKTLDLI